jgi:hypothetical protein
LQKQFSSKDSALLARKPFSLLVALHEYSACSTNLLTRAINEEWKGITDMVLRQKLQNRLT